MAVLTGTGLGTEGDDIGSGSAVLVGQSAITRVCFYQTTAEEIVEIQSATYAVNENAGTLTMTYIRENSRVGKALDFAVAATPGTALLGTHYQSVSTPIVFSAGQTESTGTIAILDANLGPGNSRTFTVNIAPPPTQNKYTRAATSRATITINGVP